ncbi:hypothetical protein ACDF64_11420 [Agromyces sp. MMS24-JH15]|uniref:hypothetical protein n=1 Tax=Agromyces sp. MMS24-JH15 TaxID=3243765 RepID=UPI003747FDFA
MPRPELPADRHGFVRADVARARGQSAPLRSAHAAGELVRLRRGVYADRSAFSGLAPVARHAERARAVAAQRRDPVFAGVTAAVLHGLPVVGRVPEEIFVLSGTASGRRRNGVVELGRRGTETVDEVDGLRLTTVEESLIEVARRMPHLTALVMADAALLVPRFGARAPRCTPESLARAYLERLPFPSSRPAAAMIERAVTCAETPLETVSRARLDEFGAPPPRLQESVSLPRLGSTVFLDFAWPELGVWGEADGRGKYAGAGSSGDPREVLLAEKRREDEIRAVTGWRCVRWGWDDAWRPAAFRAILAAAGIPMRR